MSPCFGQQEHTPTESHFQLFRNDDYGALIKPQLDSLMECYSYTTVSNLETRILIEVLRDLGTRCAALTKSLSNQA